MKLLFGVALCAAAASATAPVSNMKRYKSLLTVGANATEPTQLHAAFGQDPTSTLLFSWATVESASTELRYGKSGGALSNSVTGTSASFDQPAEYFHRVNVTGLEPGTAYDYVVGSASGGWSNLTTIHTAPAYGTPEADAFTWAVYGDMGLENERSLPLLIADVEAGRINGVLHVGDLAYDLDSDSGARGDAFMNSIAPIASQVAYQTCPGNHESADDFLQYRSRFYMPGDTDSIYHSIDVGNAHIVMLSSEVYFYIGAHSALMLPAQYAWLEADLAAAAARNANGRRMWTAVHFHRPQYCAPNDDNDDCHHVDSLVRLGVLGQFGMEELFQKYGVDLVITAHEHSYSRSYPLYNYSFDKDAVTTQPDGTTVYTNPTKPVHIINGAAGCPENQDGWQNVTTDWVAYKANVYGYARISFPNATTAVWNYVNDSDGSILDKVVFHQTGSAARVV